MQDGEWHTAVLKLEDAATKRLPVTNVFWPNKVEPEKLLLDFGSICFRWIQSVTNESSFKTYSLSANQNAR